jgi:hypothetical protein
VLWFGDELRRSSIWELQEEFHSMSETLLEPGERARTQLRAAIAEVTLNVSSLSHESNATNQAAQASVLTSAWQKLVPLIEPEAEPARRTCPHCHRRIRVQATRCLYCLEKSVASGGQ